MDTASHTHQEWLENTGEKSNCNMNADEEFES